MRASAPSSASAANAGARGAAPQPADPSGSSKSFSDLLVGTTPTATGGKSSPKSTPLSPTAASGSKAAPADTADAAAATKSSSRADSTPADSTPATSTSATSTSTAADSSAEAPASTDTKVAATELPLVVTTASPPESDDAVEADAAIAEPTDSAAARPAGRRTSLTDAAASANVMSAQSMWLMAAGAMTSPGAAVVPPATPAAAATSNDSFNAATALGALTANAGTADTAPVSSSAMGGDNTAAATSATTAATVASSAASVLSEFQAAPPAPGTGADDDAPGDSDASGNGAQASPDHARAPTEVSSPDLSTLAQLVRGVSAANAQTGGIERSIGTPVSDPGWSRDVAAQVQIMASARIQSATLRLSPEHLGPVEVHIDMQASQINVNFVAAHPDTRSALEQSVPTLRAMLAHGGLTLGQTQVQGEARSGSQSAGGRARDNALPDHGEEPIAAAAVRNAGLIDEYA